MPEKLGLSSAVPLGLAKDHSNDITFENEIKKPEVKEIKETVSETKAETKSSLTFGE